MPMDYRILLMVLFITLLSIVNLIILALNLKLYTEMFKQIAQESRQR